MWKNTWIRAFASRKVLHCSITSNKSLIKRKKLYMHTFVIRFYAECADELLSFDNLVCPWQSSSTYCEHWLLNQIPLFSLSCKEKIGNEVFLENGNTLNFCWDPLMSFIVASVCESLFCILHWFLIFLIYC